MIIFGSRMYFRSNSVQSYGQCSNCGRYTRLFSYQATRFGHIYFIPLIPMSSKSQVLRECGSCQVGSHITAAELPPIVDQITDQFKSWISEVQAGNTEIRFAQSGETMNVGILISSILDDLYCLKQIENVDSISAVLQAQEMAFENELVLARWAGLKGDLQASQYHYWQAHKIQSDQPLPLFQIGHINVLLGNAAGAEKAFGDYLNLCPGDISAHIELASLYETKKDYSKIVEAYDNIYSLNTDLVRDSGMRKVYKKACKKSGQQGKFLGQM